MRLEFYSCYKCRRLLERNYMIAKMDARCHCGSRHVSPRYMSWFEQLVYVLLRPFYWKDLFLGRD